MQKINVELIKRIDGMIRRGSTGNSVRFSARLHISRSMLFYYMAEMKRLGAPIANNRMQGFHYRSPVNFVCEFIASNELLRRAVQ